MDDQKEDFSDLPPNQRRKKLQQKIDLINKEIGKETAERYFKMISKFCVLFLLTLQFFSYLKLFENQYLYDQFLRAELLMKINVLTFNFCYEKCSKY